MTKQKFIPIETLLELKTNDEPFKLVEILIEENYHEGHIPGAINIPLQDVEDGKTDQLEKDETIIVYSASYTCPGSTLATKELLDRGYKNVLNFKAGKKGWVNAGFELEVE